MKKLLALIKLIVLSELNKDNLELSSASQKNKEKKNIISRLFNFNNNNKNKFKDIYSKCYILHD